MMNLSRIGVGSVVERAGRASGCAGLMRAALAAGSCVLGAGPAAAQLSVGGNVNISRQAGDQAEGVIVINPTNPLNLFALYNNLGSGNGQFGAVSTNGGVSWTTRAVGTGADGLSAAIGDPSVSFDEFGNLFLCDLTSSGINAQVGLSTNGGASFSTLATVATNADQPTIIAGAGAVWATWDKGGGINASHATVTGLGAVGAFSAGVLITSSNSGIGGSFGDPAIGPGGRVAVVYQNGNTTQGPDNVYFNVDLDGIGAGAFGPRSTVTATNVGAFDTIPAQPSRSIDAEVGLAYDRTGGTHTGRLYLVYTDETVNENNDTNIMVRFSDNDGGSWSAATKVNDDATTRSQFLPRIALDPVTGHVAVTWYDCRNSASNNTAELWGTATLDGGATWLPNVKISAGVSTPGSSGFDFGDYNGLAMYNDAFFPIWADNSNSTGDNPNGAGTSHDMYTARVTVAAACYANCDGSTSAPVLNVGDFTCFLQRYAANDPYANCDGSTSAPVLNVGDFTCFLQKYAAGCP